jgi:hypothetical protein
MKMGKTGCEGLEEQTRDHFLIKTQGGTGNVGSYHAEFVNTTPQHLPPWWSEPLKCW